MRSTTSVTYLVFALILLIFNFSAVADTLPKEAFSKLPQFYSVALSPEGNRVAMVRNASEGDLAALMVLDLETNKNYYLIKADNKKVKIKWYKWANNEDLLVSARYENSDAGVKYFETRLYVIPYNAQGGKPKQVVNWRNIKRYQESANYVPQFQDDVIDMLPDEPNHILMAIDISRPHEKSVFKVNIKRGKLSRIIKGKKRIRDWITDQQGNVRIGTAYNYDNGDTQIFLRDKNDNYEELYAYNSVTDKPVSIAGFALDPNILYIHKYLDDRLALFKVDLTTKEEVLVLSDEKYDVDGSLIYSPLTRDAIGVGHANMPNGRFYWDDRYKVLQDGLNGLFEGQQNSLTSFSQNEDVYLLYSESDTQPGRYFIGNQKKVTLSLLFSQYPSVKAEHLSPHKKITFKARDNTDIEAYLTLPLAGEAPFPTVIFPHGGPSGREYAGFDYWTSYFSTRGYAVLRPNFRGSSGYGYSFSQAQMKGWGLAMQDDVADGTEWMISQGLANKNKICIVGASYGGFAALAATVKSPNLYQCAVSFAGVSDLNRLLYREKKFLGGDLLKNQLGDESADRKRRSPINYVESIRTPILLVHGKEDRVVHYEQSYLMADELEDANKAVKYVELPYGNHFLSIQSNRMKLFEEMDTFLSKYL